MTTQTERFTDERELVEALVRNDPVAWEVFVERYQPLVLGVARKTLRQSGARNPETLAADVSNEVFASLLANERKALTRFREPWSFKGWLSVVASRRARRVLRNAQKGHGEELPQTLSAGGRSAASDMGRIEERDRVRRSLDDLKPRDRLALQLFYEGGHSYKEVADMLGIPAKNMGMILARARKRLGKILEDRAQS